MATDLSALKIAVKFAADAASDFGKAMQDKTTQEKMSEFANLMPDFIQLLPAIGEIPLEAKALAPADYAELMEMFGADITMPAGKAKALVDASIKLLADLTTVVYPDIIAIVNATK